MSVSFRARFSKVLSDRERSCVSQMFHELAYVRQHLVVFAGRRVHLLEDGRHVAEYRRVQQRYHRQHPHHIYSPSLCVTRT